MKMTNPALVAKLQDQKLLASSADPAVPFAPNDLLKFNNKLFLLYHCMWSGYDYVCIPGCLVGALVLPLVPRFKDLTRLQAAGTGAFMGGCTGMGLGCMALIAKSSAKEPMVSGSVWDVYKQ